MFFNISFGYWNCILLMFNNIPNNLHTLQYQYAEYHYDLNKDSVWYVPSRYL